ncbi:MAG: hypothetical protein R3C12_00115 [Planctomycetaceae bacterium]
MTTTTPDVPCFNPTFVIAKLIRSTADAISIVEPFEAFAHMYNNHEQKLKWMDICHQLRSLLKKWDQPATQEYQSKLESIIQRHNALLLNQIEDTRASYCFILGRALEIAYELRLVNAAE